MSETAEGKKPMTCPSSLTSLMASLKAANNGYLLLANLTSAELRSASLAVNRGLAGFSQDAVHLPGCSPAQIWGREASARSIHGQAQGASWGLDGDFDYEDALLARAEAYQGL